MKIKFGLSNGKKATGWRCFELMKRDNRSCHPHATKGSHMPLPRGTIELKNVAQR